jgi:hypothetical protein
MSTEHQEYSTENQSDVILRYGKAHGMNIVRTYCDAGKSGLSLSGRGGLRELLNDVETVKPIIGSSLFKTSAAGDVFKMPTKAPIVVVFPRGPNDYLLLDGHVRVDILKHGRD